MSDIDGILVALHTAAGPERIASVFPVVLEAVKTEAQIYPPELPNQSYIRTFTLRDGWQYDEASISADTVSADVYNNVAYAPNVMGDETQEAIFAGRWRTESQLAAAVTPMVEATFQAALQVDVTL